MTPLYGLICASTFIVHVPCYIHPAEVFVHIGNTDLDFDIQSKNARQEEFKDRQRWFRVHVHMVLRFL